MGKELNEAAAHAKNNSMPKKLSIFKLKQSDIELHWSKLRKPPARREVSENGQVVVNIKSKSVDTTLIWAGIPFEGNRFSQISAVFRAKGILRQKERIASFALFKGFVWHTVDPITDSFQSGDKLLLHIEDYKTRGKKPRKITA